MTDLNPCGEIKLFEIPADALIRFITRYDLERGYIAGTRLSEKYDLAKDEQQNE